MLKKYRSPNPMPGIQFRRIDQELYIECYKNVFSMKGIPSLNCKDILKILGS